MLIKKKVSIRADVRPVVLLYWGRQGGGLSYTAYLARHLAETGGADVIVSLRDGNAEAPAFAGSFIKFLTVKVPNIRRLLQNPFKRLRELGKHADLLASFNPKLVIISMNCTMAWPLILFLKNRCMKVAYVAHNGIPHPGDYAVLWQQVTQNMLLRCADEVITLSHFVADHLIRRTPFRLPPITMIPIETVVPIQSEGGRHFGAIDRPVRLLCLGRLIAYKGLDLLEQALRPLRNRSDWTLTIAGAARSGGHVRRLFRDFSQVSVELDWLSEARFSELLRVHDVLICPYREASQSGVLAEAMAHGLPSIVTPVGALAEQSGFGRAAIVTDAVSAPAMTQAIEEILFDRTILPRLSEGARSLMAERHHESAWRGFVEREACHLAARW